MLKWHTYPSVLISSFLSIRYLLFLIGVFTTHPHTITISGFNSVTTSKKHWSLLEIGLTLLFLGIFPLLLQVRWIGHSLWMIDETKSFRSHRFRQICLYLLQTSYKQLFHLLYCKLAHYEVFFLLTCRFCILYHKDLNPLDLCRYIFAIVITVNKWAIKAGTNYKIFS